MKTDILISIIVVNWNACGVLRGCLHSLDATLDLPNEVIIVDNGSTDESLAMVSREFPKVQVLAQGANLGFARGNNVGVAQARGAYVLLLNPDTVVIGDALRRMVGFLERRADVSLVGPKLLDAEGLIWTVGKRRLPTPGRELLELLLVNKVVGWMRGIAARVAWAASRLDAYYRKSEECEYLSGCCLLLRRSTYLELGGFDESVPMYLDDMDLCFRTRACGGKNYYLAEASVVHLWQRSTRSVRHHKMYDVLSMQAKLYYYEKHFGPLIGLVYRGIVALSMPYLLVLDILCLAYYVSRRRWREWLWVLRKHLGYAQVIRGRMDFDILQAAAQSSR